MRTARFLDRIGTMPVAGVPAGPMPATSGRGNARSATSGRGFMGDAVLLGGMPRTLGYHIVISGFGLWLPGDERGHWSEAWDEQLGYVEPHMLHPGDPVRKQMAAERQKHPPVRLDAAMQRVAVAVIGQCCADSDWRLAAASIEATHTHLLMTYTERDVDNTVKWLKDRITKAIHRDTPHQGPVWCKGRWRSFIYEYDVWDNAQRYIERHNERRGVGPRPYPFLA